MPSSPVVRRLVVVALCVAAPLATASVTGQLPDRTQAPNAADRKPARVTPICTEERKRLGWSCSLATARPRLPCWASWSMRSALV